MWLVCTNAIWKKKKRNTFQTTDTTHTKIREELWTAFYYKSPRPSSLFFFKCNSTSLSSLDSPPPIAITATFLSPSPLSPLETNGHHHHQFFSFYSRSDRDTSITICCGRKEDFFCFVRPSPDAVPGRLIHLLLLSLLNTTPDGLPILHPPEKRKTKKTEEKKRKKGTWAYTHRHIWIPSPPFYTLYSGSNQQFDYRWWDGSSERWLRVKPSAKRAQTASYIPLYYYAVLQSSHNKPPRRIACVCRMIGWLTVGQWPSLVQSFGGPAVWTGVHRVYQCHWPLFFIFVFSLFFCPFQLSLQVSRKALQSLWNVWNDCCVLLAFCGFDFHIHILVRASVVFQKSFFYVNSAIGQRPKFVIEKIIGHPDRSPT